MTTVNIDFHRHYRPQTNVVSVADHTLRLSGVNSELRGIPGALKFEAAARVLSQGGETTTRPDSITVAGADSATILIAAATSYRNYHDTSGRPETTVTRQLRAAGKKPFAGLLGAHVAEHQRLFRRVRLDLGNSAAARLPTDERIRNFEQANDPQLAALYFQCGRYLLIACSRPGDQPANLQGLWNESMTPPWDSKYTININTEMNYWPAETCNLSECHEPLFAMIEDLTRTGARTARVHYGARGWVAHHNTDLWRATGPVDGAVYGFWPSGGAWLCLHLWEHYRFTGDRKFLAKSYPAMKGAAQFFLDTLVEEPTHKWLVTCPSLSPENKHPYRTSICAGPTMDMQILRDLFANPYATVTIANVDVYDRFPYLETREFEVVSDTRWNRLVYGERGQSLSAYDGAGGSDWAVAMFREADFLIKFQSDQEADTGVPYSLQIAGNGQTGSDANVVWSVSPINLAAGRQVTAVVTGLFLASPTADAPVTVTLTNKHAAAYDA